MAAGPTRTTKIAGKMNRTSGKISCTAVFAAFSSANCRRRVRSNRIGPAAPGRYSTQPVGLDQNRGQAPHIIHPRPDAEVVENFPCW